MNVQSRPPVIERERKPYEWAASGRRILLGRQDILQAPPVSNVGIAHNRELVVIHERTGQPIPVGDQQGKSDDAREPEHCVEGRGGRGRRAARGGRTVALGAPMYLHHGLTLSGSAPDRSLASTPDPPEQPPERDEPRIREALDNSTRGSPITRPLTPSKKSATMSEVYLVSVCRPEHGW